MIKEAYITHIYQNRVRILGPKDFDGYERNRPGPRWELIEYTTEKDDNGNLIRVWTPEYTLQYGKINDYSLVKIVNKDNGSDIKSENDHAN
jgi:hypothetical protein